MKETRVTEEGKGLPSVAELFGVVHTVNDGAAALPGVEEFICTA